MSLPKPPTRSASWWIFSEIVQRLIRFRGGLGSDFDIASASIRNLCGHFLRGKDFGRRLRGGGKTSDVSPNACLGSVSGAASVVPRGLGLPPRVDSGAGRFLIDV